jgi:RNA recognition motif-containing protein
VGNLSHEITEDELKQTLEEFGQAESVDIIKDKNSK